MNIDCIFEYINFKMCLYLSLQFEERLKHYIHIHVCMLIFVAVEVTVTVISICILYIYIYLVV